MSSPFVGPIPPYNNPPIEPQFFAPWRFQITDIQFGATTIVTLDVPAITNLNYSVGMNVKFVIPPSNGCRQLNGVSAYVLEILSSNQILLDLDTIGGDPFVTSSNRQIPQLLPVGDINYGAINIDPANMSLTVPGAFINISPDGE